MATPSIRNSHARHTAIRWTAGDTLPPVDEVGGSMPLLVDATTGKLLVDAQATISTDLSLIESKMDTANGIATGQAADTAAIKSSNTKVAGFSIPPYNDVVMEYTNGSFPTKPTEIIFKQNGTPVYYLALTYDVNGAVTRVQQD